MSPRGSPKLAIDVYDDRVCSILNLWKMELAVADVREQADLAEWRRAQREWSNGWSGSGAASDALSAIAESIVLAAERANRN